MTSRLRAGLASGSTGFLARAVSQLAVLGITIVASRVLGTATFGAYAIALAFSYLSRNLLYVGPYEYLLKSPLTPTLAASCLIANVGLAVVMAGLVAVLSLFAEPLFGTPDVGWLLVRLAPTFLLVAVSSWCEALLLRDGDMRRYYLTIVIGDIAGAVVAVACLSAGLGLAALVIHAYVRMGTMTLLYLAYRGFRIETGGSRGEVGGVLAWSRARYGASLLNFGSGYGADLVLGLLLSPAATGLYRAASRIVSALSDLFAQPLLKIAQTNVSARLAAGEGPGLGWLAMFGGIAAVAWAALAGLALGAGDIVPFVLGEQWHPAAPLVAVFCAARGLLLLDAVTTPLLVAVDQQRFMLPIQTAAAVAVVAASVALAPWGPMPVAMASAVIALAMSSLYARRALRLAAAPAPAFGAALAVAVTPALGVAAAWAGSELAAAAGSALHPLAGLAAMAAGGIAGLVLVRRPLGRSLAALAGPGAVT
jgi:O-antigen/teichoic acid export membrane protein